LVEVDPEPIGGWKDRSERALQQTASCRRRFLIAHEVAHSFFYSRRPGRSPRRALPDSVELEAFCDRFAASLLLPPGLVRRSKPVPSKIVRLAQRYGVSLELAVRAFNDAHPDVFLGLLTENGDERLPLRVQWRSPGHRLPPRWWTDDWIQTMPLDRAAPEAMGRQLSWDGHSVVTRWLALPRRHQVLVSATVPGAA
jgi:hypothetical protein